MTERPDDKAKPVSNAPVSAADAARSRRARNIAIGLGILAFCVLIYAITLAKLGSAVLKTS